MGFRLGPGLVDKGKDIVITRRDFVAGSGLIVATTLARNAWGTNPDPASFVIPVDLGKVTGPLPHVWEEIAGSDRVVVGLREQWRQDLIHVHRDTGIRSIRCHGLFDDEMGIAAGPAHRFNFLYVDQIYDFMLDQGVKPFVELSFMPEAFATSNNRIFAYKGNASPPRNWQDWHDMVRAFADHCVKRYGAAEVRQWRFEVWNEPNIDFWAGTQEEYFELYRQSVMALKSVDGRLQVGGPATAQLGWIPDLIRYCSAKNLSLDFVSTHIYPDDPQGKIFGRAKVYPFEQVIPRGIELARHQIETSAMPHLPLLITEWSSQNPAFIFDTIKNCIGQAEALAYWTFSNVFEEGGVPSGVFNDVFGLLDQWGIARPSLHAFSFLHRLGEERLQAGAGPVLATRRSDGSLAILVWNLLPAANSSSVANGNPMAASGGNSAKGAELVATLQLKGLSGRKQTRIARIGGEIGSALPAWKAMGSPQYPSRDQLIQLRKSAELPPPETRTLQGTEPEEISIHLPPNGVAILEFDR